MDHMRIAKIVADAKATEKEVSVKYTNDREKYRSTIGYPYFDSRFPNYLMLNYDEGQQTLGIDLSLITDITIRND